MSREVLEFIIVPPFSKRAEVDAAKERLVAYLGYHFPGYTFKVARFVPVVDEDRFTVLPVMNFVGDDGKSFMCEQPRRWLIRDIADACAMFKLTGKKSFAA